MFQARRAREDSRASPAAVFRVHDEFNRFTTIAVKLSWDVATYYWGDLPDSHWPFQVHSLVCCCYTKISIELAVQAGFEPARCALTARRSTR